MSTSYFLSQFPRHLAIVALGPMSDPKGSSPSGLMLDLRQLLWGACDKKQVMCLSCSIGLIYDHIHVMSGCVFFYPGQVLMMVHVGHQIWINSLHKVTS